MEGDQSKYIHFADYKPIRHCWSALDGRAAEHSEDEEEVNERAIKFFEWFPKIIQFSDLPWEGDNHESKPLHVPRLSFAAILHVSTTTVSTQVSKSFGHKDVCS